MKELEQHIKKGDKTAVHAQRQQQNEHQKVLQGTIKPLPGQIVWEINIETGEISEAYYKQIDVDFEAAINKDFSPRKELITKDGFVYIPAINKQNALKKFNKNKSQEKYFAAAPIFDIKNIYNL
jgi:hypothetical protein